MASFNQILDNTGGAFLIAGNLLLAPLLKRWRERWGATAEEAARALPGDELVPHPRSRYTRAIPIHAPAAAVWPWLAQMGQGRGGLYSYDLLENIARCDIHSVDRIIPELQVLAVGDLIRLGPEGYPFFRVVGIQPNHALILQGGTGEAQPPGPDLPDDYTISTWVFYLDEQRDSSTRLLLRGLLDYKPTGMMKLIWGLTDVIGFVMMRRMMIGIKQRAEAAAMADGR